MTYSIRTKQNNVRKKRKGEGENRSRRKIREDKMRERVEFALVVDKPRRLPRNVALKVFQTSSP